MPAILTYALLSIPFIGAYAIFALGISLIYRASRVLNLAHGAMAMVPAYIMYSLVQVHVPMVVALFVAVVSGAALGVGVERIFVRRLRAAGPTAQTVGTVAVTGLLIALAAKIWGTNPRIAPSVFPKDIISVGQSGIRYGDIGLFVTGIVVSLALFTFFKRTQFGLALRGAAQNRRAASLMGINPDLTAAATWALGGGLAAIGGVMLAGVTNLDPYNLSLQVLPAFVAALIGGLESLPGALWGSAIAGLSFGLVPYFSGTPIIGNVIRYSGSTQLTLTILALIVLATRGRRLTGAESSDAGLAMSARATKSTDSRRFGRRLIIGGLVLAVWPWVVPYSVLGDSLLAIELGLVALSIVVLTGWVGQISLGHASFVGIASLVTGLLARNLGLGFPANLLVAGAVAAVAATLLGIVALRVRGLYLAVATLIFAWMCDSFLFRTPWLGASGGSSTIPNQPLGIEGAAPTIDLTSRKTLFYVFAALIGIVLFVLANLRDSKTGRAFFAVRGSEMAAASLGIDVVRMKLAAFALSGAVAGIAGSALMIDQRTVVPSQFLFTVSLQYLAIAVVGGLGSLGGAVAAGAVFAALNEVFYKVAFLSGWLEVVSAGLLAFVLLAYPGGLAAVPDSAQRVSSRLRAGFSRAKKRISRPVVVQEVRRTPRPSGVVSAGLARALRPVGGAARVLAGRLRRRPAVPGMAGDWLTLAAAPVPEPEPSSNGRSNGHHEDEPIRLGPMAAEPPDLRHRDERTPILEANGIVVRFGGLTAVNEVALTVREGEIVGLIGPNGAGKTTMFNAILGLNSPAAGTVRLYGRDATSLPPHLRARIGVARTFQVLQLFGELSVFDNLLVATHVHNRSGVLSNLVAAGRSLDAETDARRRVAHVLKLLSLDAIADEPARGLPFGILRMVELARALVTGARLVMLDEPASGLNEAETDRLASIVRTIRGLGVSVLLIEHDVRMVTGVSDYMYVMEQGKLIAEGAPSEVGHDPLVIAAYLGEPATQPAGV